MLIDVYRRILWLLHLHWCLAAVCKKAAWREMTENACMPAILLPQITGYSSLTARRSNALTARNMCPSPERLHNERRRIHSIRSAPTSAVEFDPTAVCFPISALPSNCVVVGPPENCKTLRAVRLLDVVWTAAARRIHALDRKLKIQRPTRNGNID